ncbi:type IV toxin-antitoxin system AbiEi family antitoxin domain-containing protein [Parapedobacter tibetensis]|uniref:type IV toxin-antitoxin system AbiEi family antitoxin domain-containing protein n=1 Tax=Parapedobacter tibetensis TaxID=2972951 RepID=UPI00214D3F8A|nr:type IV toxin-antitoxin system AbiEi family antitoxin [Parapedobacter tibetensis]
MNVSREYGRLESYLDNLVALGRYSFTSNEIKEKLELTHNAFQKQVSNLSERRKVTLIRKGFYVIVPPEYRKNGAPPVTYYIDGMMKGLKRPYYVGLLNAAAWYGAAHQQPQKYVIIVHPPFLPSIDKSYARIDFVYKKEWQESDLIQQKTNAGYIAVSSPELTALDLCYYPRHAGGINQVATVLEELADELDAIKISGLAERYNSTKAVQRLGFLLEFLGNDELVAPLKEWLKNRKYYPALLDPVEKSQNKVTGNIWKIIVNTDIETDL